MINNKTTALKDLMMMNETKPWAYNPLAPKIEKNKKNLVKHNLLDHLPKKTLSQIN